jgi:hypothetical protein
MVVVIVIMTSWLFSKPEVEKSTCALAHLIYIQQCHKEVFGD